MKPSLALQFLSTAFTATVAASSSSASVAEEVAKKYDNHRDFDAAAASLASRNLESTKAGKSSAYCPPEPTQDVQCGNTYVNSTVILGQNLICTEGDGSFLNAALILKGKKALLDCKGYTISQNTNSSAAAMDYGTEDLFYEKGVILEDGAKMMNCNIQKFILGAGIENGSEIKDSQFSLNLRGAEIDSFGDGGANTVSKIANSEFYNNGEFGLVAFQLEDNSKIMIEDVTVKNNAYGGIALTGTGITVNNANIRNNNVYGLEIGDNVFNNFVNEITLDGHISITNNGNAGFITEDSSVQGIVHVTGNLDLNRNGEYGIATNAANLTVAVGGSYSGKSGKSGSGSLTACDNGVWDIYNYVGGTFEGSDYTCDNDKTFGSVPKCMPCHPGCDESSALETSQAMAEESMGSFMVGNRPGPVKPMLPSGLPMEN